MQIVKKKCPKDQIEAEELDHLRLYPTDGVGRGGLELVLRGPGLRLQQRRLVPPHRVKVQHLESQIDIQELKVCSINFGSGF